ncbi:hypothetical protein HN747_01690 [archaeon]|nr:hypothetical protein [archaeon]
MKKLFILLFIFLCSYSLIGMTNAGGLPADISFTPGASFSIYESSSWTWDSGTLVCTVSISDTDATISTCASNPIHPGTTYRVQASIREIAGGNDAKWENDPDDYVDHVGVMGSAGSLFGTNPTLNDAGNCVVYDSAGDNKNGNIACTVAFNGNDIRITNPTAAGAEWKAAKGGATYEGFQYLITPDTDALSNDVSYWYSEEGKSNAIEQSSRLNISVNTAPTIDNVTASHAIIKGGDTITFYANTTTNGLNDTDGDGLLIYCSNDNAPTAANNNCTGGVSGDSGYPYALSCSFDTPITNTNYTEFCRIYDGDLYSPAVNITYTADSTDPVLDIVYPANGLSSGDTGLDVNYTAIDTTTEIDSCWYSNDSMSVNTTLTNCENITSTVWSEGAHSVTIWINDSAGNIDSSTVSFFIDTIKPNVVIRHPLNSSFHSSTEIDLNLSVFDYSLMSSLSYSLNGAGNISIPLNERLNITNDVIGTGSDANNINANISQSFTPTEAMNISNVHLRLQKINNGLTNPKIQIKTDAGDTPSGVVLAEGNIYNEHVSFPYSWVTIRLNQTISLFSGSKYWISLTSEGDAVNYYEWELNSSNSYPDGEYNRNGGNFGQDLVFQIFDSYKYSTSITSIEGLNNITIYANDTVGNTNNSIQTFFTVDLSPPQVSIDYPQAINYNVDVSELNYTTSDISPDSCWYSTDNGVTNSSSVVAGVNFTGVVSVEGSNTWTVYCNDTSGSENISSITFIKDTTNPGISITSPANTTYDNLQQIVFLSASDTNLDSIWFTNPSGQNETYTAPILKTFDEGSNTLLAYANDSFGNTNSTSVVFLIDTINPQIDYGLGTEIDYANLSQSNVFVNVSVTEVNEDTIIFRLYNSSGEVNSTSYNGVVRNINWTGLLDGTYAYNVTVNDTAGNVNSTQTRTITLDTTNPEVSINSPTSQNYTRLDVNITLDEAGYCEYSIDGGVNNVSMTNNGNIEFTYTNSSIVDGVYTLEAYCNDSVGNVNHTESVIFEIDNTYPLVSINYPVNVNYSTNVSEFNYTTSDINLDSCWYSLDAGVSNISVTCGINLTGLVSEEGSNIWTVYTNDSVGNENSSSVTFWKDTVYPLVSISYPVNANYSINVSELNYTASDVNLGSCWYSIDDGVSNSSSVAAGINFTGVVSTEGANTWTVYCNDSFGNINSSAISYSKDTIYPQISYGIGTEIDYANLSQSNVFVNVSVTEVNEDTIIFRLYNSSGEVNSTSYGGVARSINWTGLLDGAYTYNVTVNDTAGNENSTDTRTITLDTLEPFVGIIAPENTSYNNQTQLVNISSSDLGVGVDTIWFTNSSGVNETYTSAVYRTFPEGSNTLKAYANDSLGHVNTTSVIFWIDTSIPILTIDSPENITYSNATILVNLTSNGNTTWFTNLSGANETYVSAVYRTFPEGSNTLKAYANNSVGTETSENILFVVDTIKPLISIDYPMNANYSTNVSELNYTASDINLDNCWYSIDDGATNSSSVVAGVNFAGVVSTEGTNTWTVYCNDTAGNVNSTDITFLKDTENPLIEYASPSETSGDLLNRNYLLINVTASDSGLGILNITINLYDSSHNLVNSSTTSSSPNYINFSNLNGEYYFNATVYDHAGNVNSTDTRNVTLDTSLPVVNILYPGNLTYNYDVSGLNYSVIDSSGESCWYSVDSGVTNSSSVAAGINFTGVVSTEGANTWTVYCNDSFGNLGYDIVIYTIETSSPQFNLAELLPQQNTVYNQSQPVALFVDIDENASAVSANVSWALSSQTINLTFNGTAWYYESSFTNTSYPGAYQVVFNATDVNGNYNSTASNFTVNDVLSPTIDFVSPTTSSGNFALDSIWANVSSYDLGGLDTVILSLYNSTELVGTVSSSSGSLFNNFTSLADGTYYLNASANDTSGNTNYTETRTITLDLGTAAISISAPSDNENISSSTFNLNFSVSGEDSLDNVWYELNGVNTSFSLEDNLFVGNSLIGDDDEDDISFANLSQSFTLGEDMSVRDVSIYLKKNLAGGSGVTLQVRNDAGNTPGSTILAEATINSANVLTGYSWINLSLNQTASLSAGTTYWLFMSPSSSAPNFYFWMSNTSNPYSGGNYSNDNTKDLLFKVFDHFEYRAELTETDGDYNITIYANDSLNNIGSSSKVSFSVDTTSPAYSSIGETDPINLSNTETITIDINDAVSGVDTVLLEFDSQNHTMALSSGDSSSGTWSYSWVPSFPGVINYSFFMNDSAGNSNLTSTFDFTVNDSSGYPIITNLVYSPNESSRLDPNVSISVSVNVSDQNLDKVFLIYSNSTGPWQNIEMTNVSTLFSANFTPDTEDIWKFFIQANDTGGLTTNYSETNISVFYDWNWTISPNDFGTIAVIAGNTAHLVDLVINNTGDFDLTFDLNTINNLSGNTWSRIAYNETEPFSLSPKEVKIIEVSSTSDTNWLAGDFSLIIRTDSVNASAVPSESNISGILRISTTTLVPSLDVSIVDYDSTPTQGDTNISYKTRVINSGTAAASNVTLNWTLPSGFTILSGSLSTNVSSLDIDQILWNNITVNVASSTTAGATTISASSNSSGGYDSNTSREISITAPSVTIVPGTGGGSGGGSGGTAGGGISEIVYDRTVEVVRGEGEEFEITVENIYPNYTLEDLTITLTGFSEQYFSINPSIIRNVEYGESKSFTVKLSAPEYKSFEERSLIARISGMKVRGTSEIGYSEKQNILLIIEEISTIDAQEIFFEAKDALGEMKENGLNTLGLERILESANDELISRQNKKSYSLSMEIINAKETAEKTNNLLFRIVNAMIEPKKTHLLVGNAVFEIDNAELEKLIVQDNVFSNQEISNLIQLSYAAYSRGDYETALERAQSARELLILERKGNPIIFIYLYWPYIIITLIVAILLFVWIHRRRKIAHVKQRIMDIGNEEKELRSKLIRGQKVYFAGKMSQTDYQRLINLTNKKMASIRRERVKLRHKRIRLLSSDAIIKDLDKEKTQVERDIRHIQIKFYKNKKIGETEYKTQFNALNARLAEIENERITSKLGKEGNKK